MLYILTAIAALLMLSAFFSAAETALTAASRPLMHHLEREGDKRAAIVNRLRQKKRRLLGALLIGNNMVNIMASALATSVMIGIYGEAGVAIATIVMTVLVVFFSEILPKTYAIKKANSTAMALAPLTNAVVAALGPLTAVINIAARGLFSMFGVNFSKDVPHGPASMELRGAIELHGGGKHAVKHERDMLRSILDLNEVRVSEIMEHRKNVTMINADLPVDAVVAEALDSQFTRIPLWRGHQDNIIGVLHAKSLLKAMQARGEKRAPLDIAALAAKPWFIHESTTLLRQLQAFRRRHQHFALIVDEYGGFTGIVTLEDILEEIVGEISDEHDIAAAEVRPHPDGGYIVTGDVTIRDLNRQFGWNLSDKNAATIAGLVLLESRRIPETGQAFKFHGFRFVIMRRERHQITLIRVVPPATGEKSEDQEAP